MNEDASDRTLHLERRVRATPQQLWEAWTDPSQLRSWWWPERFNTTYSIDSQPGGSYRFTTEELPDIGVLDLAGTFLVVEEPRRLVYSWRWESDLGHESQVTTTFEQNDGSSVISLTQSGLADEQDRDNHIVGWNDCLDRLEKYVDQDD